MAGASRGSHAGDEIPPGSRRSAAAQGLTEPATRRPAGLALRGLVTLHQTVVDCGQGLMSNIADDGVDLLDARGDVADVIDVEALDARAARRHCVGAQERVDAREIVMEGAKVRVLPPQGDELFGERRRWESLSRRAAESVRGEQGHRVADAASRAQLEQGLEIAPVVLHEYGHPVHLTLAVGRRGPERVDGSPGPVERAGPPALPAMSAGLRV